MIDSRLADKTAAAIARKILGGEWQNGYKLPPDSELCAEYGVSRTALREALRILTAKGLLFAKPRAGTCLTAPQDWSLWDSDILRWLSKCPTHAGFLAHAHKMRQTIEPAIIAQISKSTDEPPEEDREEAKRNLQTALRHLQTTPTLEAECAFIDALYSAATNPFAHRLRLLVHYILEHRMKAPIPLADYTALVAAISQGQAEQATALSKKMLVDF
ncbi:MAG: FadR family transcriptional regulator [Alphaproteobacteria bacterium]|nr:FadR family transcriptional regulator [Alphaproteobacteria bacterium]